MKLLFKINLYALAVLFLTSCLKERNDLGGMNDDPGTIVTTIAEVEYIDQDNHNIGNAYYANANFSYTSIPNEMVKFFTIHVAQPRKTKLSGPLKLKISMVSIGGDPIPAGAITIPAEVEFPAFTENSKDYAVKFAVNKSLLSPTGDYAAEFTITSANQGVVSSTGSTLEVYFHNSKYWGRYNSETTVIDPAGVLRMDKNYKPVLLDNPANWAFLGMGIPSSPLTLSFVDEYAINVIYGNSNGFYTLVNNLTSGTTAGTSALVAPSFILDANENLIQVRNSFNNNNYNVTLNGDAANKFIYNSNDDRVFNISYNVTLTAALPGGATSSRIFKVMETYTYHPIQVRIF